MLIVPIVVTILALALIRNDRRSTLETKYRFTLFALRDELREAAGRDSLIRRSWLFDYFDSTTAKAIGNLHSLSIWKLLALVLAYSGDKRYEALSRQLDLELEKPEFAQLKEYENKLIFVHFQYLQQRHGMLVSILRVVDWVSLPAKVFVEEMRKKSLEAAIKSPELSTLPEYEPTACFA